MRKRNLYWLVFFIFSIFFILLVPSCKKNSSSTYDLIEKQNGNICTYTYAKYENDTSTTTSSSKPKPIRYCFTLCKTCPSGQLPIT